MATPNPLAKTVTDRWEKAHRALGKDRRNFWLNAAFYEDEQWVWWDRFRNVAQAMPERESDDERVRLAINRIQPNLVTLMARLVKAELSFEVLATEADDGTLGGARLAEFILDHKRLDAKWEAVREENLLLEFLGGTSAIAVDWDPSAGAKIGSDPAQPDRGLYQGDCRLVPLSIAEFSLEPGSRRADDAMWWVRSTLCPPEQVQGVYDLPKTPPADASGSYSPLQRMLLGTRDTQQTDLTTVLVMCERPHRNSKGRCVTVVDNEVVAEDPWPFPFSDRLNLYVFRQQKVPLRWTGNTLLNAARPIQAAYNHARSNMAEHMKLAGAAKLAVPDSSLDMIMEQEDLPGQYLPYDSTAGQPNWLSPPNLPRWLIQEADRLKDELDDITHVHDISRGVASGAGSGVALSLLAEKDDSPLGLMGKDQAEGWGAVASMVLSLYSHKGAQDLRTARVQTDTGVPFVKQWKGAELHGQTQARVPLDSTMPHSRVALQALILNLVDRKLIPPDPSLVQRIMDVPGASKIGEMLNADATRAQRENQQMSLGRVPSIGDTAGPFDWDVHPIHLAEHGRFRKSEAYEFLPTEVRKIVDDHIKAHELLETEQHAKQMAKQQLAPGMEGIAQGDQPPGSILPPPLAEQAALQQMPQMGSPPAPPADQNMAPLGGMP